MKYLMDGKIPIEINEEDVALARIFLKEGNNPYWLIQQFRLCELSNEQSICTVAQAQKETQCRL